MKQSAIKESKWVERSRETHHPRPQKEQKEQKEQEEAAEKLISP